MMMMMVIDDNDDNNNDKKKNKCLGDEERGEKGEVDPSNGSSMGCLKTMFNSVR
jgi:hypothetical protein